MRRDALYALGLMLCLTGCMTDAATPGPVATTQPVLPPADPVAQTTRATYLVKPGDAMDVAVFHVPELTRSGFVNSNGTFTMPMLGDVPVVGKTTSEVAADLTNRLRPNYLVNPQVSVTVKETSTAQFTIEGAVNQPGIFEMTGETTLLQAIAVARGPSPTAAPGEVAVFRTVNGQRVVGLIDLSDVRTGRAPDPKIYANDMIVVPSNNTSEMLRTVVTGIPIISLFMR